jgi:hypothetical protein
MTMSCVAEVAGDCERAVVAMTVSDRNARKVLFFMDCPWLRAIACRKQGRIAIRTGRGKEKVKGFNTEGSEIEAKRARRTEETQETGQREKPQVQKADPSRLRASSELFDFSRLSGFQRVVPFYIRYGRRAIAVRGCLRWDKGVGRLSRLKVNHEAQRYYLCVCSVSAFASCV